MVYLKSCMGHFSRISILVPGGFLNLQLHEGWGQTKITISQAAGWSLSSQGCGYIEICCAAWEKWNQVLSKKAENMQSAFWDPGFCLIGTVLKWKRVLPSLLSHLFFSYSLVSLLKFRKRVFLSSLGSSFPQQTAEWVSCCCYVVCSGCAEGLLQQNYTFVLSASHKTFLCINPNNSMDRDWPSVSDCHLPLVQLSHAKPGKL